MKPFIRNTGLGLLFLFTFFLFLLLTFDYGVLKEAITSQVSQKTGLNITVGTMRPSFPLGIEVQDFMLQSADSQKLEFGSVRVGVSVLNLLIGKLALEANVTGPKGGELKAQVKFGLMDAIKQQISLPKSVSLNSKDFPLDNIVSFAVHSIANAPGTSPLLAPMLNDVVLSSKLDAKVDLSLDSKDPGQSTGTVDIQFRDAKLTLNTRSLGLPDQEFKNAKIKANLKAGTLLFAEGSGLEAKDLELSIKGQLTLATRIDATQLKMRIGFKLKDALRESLGFIMGAVGGNGESGELNMELSGTAGNPQVQTL